MYESGTLQINNGIVLTNSGNIYTGLESPCGLGNIQPLGTGTISGTAATSGCPPQL